MTDEKKYWTEVPNIIDDLGLDPHERALYVHYKRACGADNREWIESIRITGERTKMSHSRASMARNSLVKRGLITVSSKGNDGTAVRIVDIWELNTAFYKDEHRPDIDGWTVSQLREWCTGVHNVNTIIEESLPEQRKNGLSPEGVHNANTGVHNMNNKKEPYKNHQDISSKDDSGKPPSFSEPEKVEPEKPPEPPPETQATFGPEFTLDPDTPETILLFEKLNQTRSAQNRNKAKRFGNLEQKKKCLCAAQRLGYEKFSEGISTALSNGIPADLKALVNWIAKWKGNSNGNHAQPKYVSPPKGNRPESTEGTPALAEQLTAAFRARAKGGGPSP